MENLCIVLGAHESSPVAQQLYWDLCATDPSPQSRINLSDPMQTAVLSDSPKPKTGKENCRGQPNKVYVPSKDKCDCIAGYVWNGSECKRPGLTISNIPTATCMSGKIYDPKQFKCICSGKTKWDGESCIPR